MRRRCGVWLVVGVRAGSDGAASVVGPGCVAAVGVAIRSPAAFGCVGADAAAPVVAVGMATSARARVSVLPKVGSLVWFPFRCRGMVAVFMWVHLLSLCQGRCRAMPGTCTQSAHTPVLGMEAIALTAPPLPSGSLFGLPLLRDRCAPLLAF